MRRLLLSPPLWNVFLASSTSTATSVGSGEIESVPVSIRAASRRSLISSRIRSAWVSMIRWNWRVSEGPRDAEGSSNVAAEPLIEERGARSSWLTVARNSARSRSSSSRGAMSCKVTTTDSIWPSSERIGVAFTSTAADRPPGASITTFSARTGSPASSTSVRGDSRRLISLPSARRTLTASVSCSAGCPGVRSPSKILLASWLTDTGALVLVSKTSTPTGAVLIRVSRSVLARCSSLCVRALAITSAAWEANMTRDSSSSRVNTCPGSCFPRWM